VCGLGGAGKSQLVLHYVQEWRQDYSVVFWIEEGQKETIEWGFLRVYRRLCEDSTATTQDRIKIEDAVLAVKGWFHCRKGRWLVVLDSADAIDHDQDESYINLQFFVPDTPGVDVIITSRSVNGKDITRMEAVEVAEMEPTEATELLISSAKLKNWNQEAEEEANLIVEELGCHALAITLAGSYVAATPRLSSDLRRYLPGYRAQRKKLLSRKPTRNIHQYRESVLSTWESSFNAIMAISPLASRLLGFLAFFNFDDIFLGLLGLDSEDSGLPAQELSTSHGQNNDDSDERVQESTSGSK
jgi:NB-ARC domain